MKHIVSSAWWREPPHAPWITSLLVLLAVCVYIVQGPAADAFIFDRERISDGELWRLVTAHWVHSDLEHLLWNGVALLILGFVFELYLGWRTIPILLAGTLAVDVWLWWGVPSLQLYCGLSGILNALLVAGLFLRWRTDPHWVLLAIGLTAAAKLGLELILGAAVLTSTSWPALPSAHAAGFVMGLIIGWASIIRRPNVAEAADRTQLLRAP